MVSVKELWEMAKSGATIDAQKVIMQLQERDLESDEEILALRQEVSALKGRLELQDQVTNEDSSYWRFKDGERAGPFCQRCYDVDGQLVRLQCSQSYETEFSGWICKGCEKEFTLRAARAEA